MALVSLSRVMGRREMKIIKRENSSTLLSLKMLSEQNYSINLKLSNKIIFVTFRYITSLVVDMDKPWIHHCSLKDIGNWNFFNLILPNVFGVGPTKHRLLKLMVRERSDDGHMKVR